MAPRRTRRHWRVGYSLLHDLHDRRRAESGEPGAAGAPLGKWRGVALRARPRGSARPVALRVGRACGLEAARACCAPPARARVGTYTLGATFQTPAWNARRTLSWVYAHAQPHD